MPAPARASVLLVASGCEPAPRLADEIVRHQLAIDDCPCAGLRESVGSRNIFPFPLESTQMSAHWLSRFQAAAALPARGQVVWWAARIPVTQATTLISECQP